MYIYIYLFIYLITVGQTCQTNNGGCEHICANIQTGVKCACYIGYQLINGKSCKGELKSLFTPTENTNVLVQIIMSASLVMEVVPTIVPIQLGVIIVDVQEDISLNLTIMTVLNVSYIDDELIFPNWYCNEMYLYTYYSMYSRIYHCMHPDTYVGTVEISG